MLLSSGTLSQARLAEMLDVSQGTVSKWKHARTEISGEHFAQIVSLLRDTIGRNPELSEDEREPINQWLDDIGKKRHRTGKVALVLPFPNRTEPLVGSFDPDTPDDDVDPDRAPTRSDFPPNAIVELEARGGMGGGETVEVRYTRHKGDTLAEDAVKAEYWLLPEPFVHTELRTTASNVIVIECKGDSMTPTLSPGERVFVDTSVDRPEVHGVYAIRGPFDEIQIKRLETLYTSGKILIISDNPTHTRQEVDIDQITIIGRVLGSFRRF